MADESSEAALRGLGAPSLPRCLRSSSSNLEGAAGSPKALPAASSRLPPGADPRPPLLILPSQLTFVPNQVVADEDEEDEQQKDNERHDPANDGVVGAGGRGHRTGVWREGAMHTGQA